MQALKYVVFILNLLAWALGLAILVFSLYLRFSPVQEDFYSMSIDSAEYTETAIWNLHLPLYLLMAAGVLMTIIGFFGCCGAMRENQCLLSFYFIMVFVILVIEGAAVVLYIIKKDDIEKGFEDLINKGVTAINENKPDKNTQLLNSIQMSLQCCGAKGPADYDKIPTSCCRAQTDVCADADVFQAGCPARVNEWLKMHIFIMMGIIIGIIILQFIGIITSMCLCCRIRRDKEFFI